MRYIYILNKHVCNKFNYIFDTRHVKCKRRILIIRLHLFNIIQFKNLNYPCFKNQFKYVILSGLWLYVCYLCKCLQSKLSRFSTYT